MNVSGAILRLWKAVPREVRLSFERHPVDDVRTLEAERDQLREVVRTYHEWLERHDELMRPERPGGPRRGYIGLDHKVGENVEGCVGCRALSTLDPTEAPEWNTPEPHVRRGVPVDMSDYPDANPTETPR